MTMIANPAGFVAFLTPSSNEIIIIVFLAFLLFGAKKIPELMRSLGRAQGEFQSAKKQFDKEVSATSKAPRAASPAPAAAAPPPASDAATSAPAPAEPPAPAAEDKPQS